MNAKVILGCLLLCCGPIYGAIELPKNKFDINLNEPVFQNGILKTTKGGIIKGEDFFLQADRIEYIKRVDKKKEIQTIAAEGNLCFIISGRTYVADRVEVDLTTRKSILYNGCTKVDNWFVGGKKISLDSDGKGIISNGYVTTSENENNDWSISSPDVTLLKNGAVKAHNVGFFFIRMPILWIPSYSTNLKQNHSSPIKYRVRWGGHLGPRVGISYKLFNSNHFKADLLGDLILRKGVGAGVMTEYKTKKRTFKTYNYVAHDVTAHKEHKNMRYRFRGDYKETALPHGIGFKATYDKISDLDMRSDYMNQGLDSTRILSTEARLSKRSPNWISSLNAKTRVNNFQTIKEELPLFQFNARPYQFGSSHIFLSNTLNAGYLSYKYAKNARNVSDFHSSRVELSQKLFRTFYLSPFVFTPEIGHTTISYNNSPHGDAKWAAVGKLGAECHTSFVNNGTIVSDLLEPYVRYDYYTRPSTSPDNHYIFDLNDGWHRLNMLRFGLRNFITPSRESNFKGFDCDLYTRAFFNTPTMPRTIPWVWAESTLKPTAYTAYAARLGYDTKRNEMGHVGLRGDFTVSEDVALNLEWRLRNAYDFRKLDRENFMINSFRSEQQLRHSELSDKRQAILTGIFVRLNPTLTLELKTRHGFAREHQPHYYAYEADLTTLVRGALTVTFSIQKRSHSAPRFSIDFDLGLSKPRFDKEPQIGYANYNN